MKKLLALLFALCFSSQLMCNTLTWAAPTLISTLGVDASQAVVVIDLSGNTTAAWVEAGIVVSRTQPNGGGWGLLSTLSSTGASSPILGVDAGGNITAIWLESGVVKSANRPFSTGIWSVATTLSGSGATTPVLAVDAAGDAVAVWTRGGFIEAIQHPNAGSWGTVSMLSGANSDHPHVAIGKNGQIVAVWHTVITGADDIQTSTATIGGSWGAVKQVFQGLTSALNHNFPKVAVDPTGNASVLWFRSTGTGVTAENLTIFGSNLASGGAAWSIPAPVSQIPGLRDPSTLVLRLGFDDNGNGIALWGSSFDGRTFNVETTTKPTGQSLWQQPSQIASTNLYAFGADLATGSTGEALAGFMIWDGSSVTIQADEAFFAGISQPGYTVGITISLGTDNAFPRTAISATGATVNGAAVWLQFNGTNTVLQSATGTRTLLGAPSSPANTSGTTSFGVFNDKTNTLSWTGSSDPNTAGYAVYRNGVLIGGTDASTFTFVDNNRTSGETDVYQIAAIDVINSQSLVVTVTVTVP